MSLSQSQLRLLSAVGMGVLVGTSLVVIIPEGIEAVYTSSVAQGVHSHGARSINYGSPPDVLTLRPRTDPALAGVINAMPGPVVPEPAFPDVPDLESFPKITDDTSGAIGVASADGTPAPATPPATDHEEDERSPPTFFIGFSLISGFVLMFLIDKLPRHASETLQSPQTRHISLNNLSADDDVASPTTESFLRSLISPSPKQTRSLATTTGLVIHAAADGIAMGASATSSNTKLGLVIFLAIMVHKAPAAFGLTSVLLKQGLSKRAARGHLIIFSLAAPIGALSTWLLVNILGGSGMEAEGAQWWTGMLLLFSAGTFLYVAMHAMQEEAGGHESMNGMGDGGHNGGLLGSPPRKRQSPALRDTLASVVGMLIPLATQLGHHH